MIISYNDWKNVYKKLVFLSAIFVKLNKIFAGLYKINIELKSNVCFYHYT